MATRCISTTVARYWVMRTGLPVWHGLCPMQIQIQTQQQQPQPQLPHTFWPQGVNRILYKVQKSFCSCTHVNSCQNYILYINLHILLNILSKAT